MTTPDLRAAAERVIELSVQASESEDDEYSVMLLTEEAASLGCKLASHILSDLDPTPIDAETEPVEFTDVLGHHSQWQVIKWTDGRYVFSLLQSDDDGPCNWIDSDYVVFAIKTWGDLRRLCRALGVELNNNEQGE